MPKGVHEFHTGNHRGMRWRGKLPIPPHAHPLVRQLVGEANRQQTTFTEIAERAGMQLKTLSNWRYRSTPNIRDMDAAGNVLDLVLCWRKRDLETRGRHQPQPTSTAFLSMGA